MGSARTHFLEGRATPKLLVPDPQQLPQLMAELQHFL